MCLLPCCQLPIFAFVSRGTETFLAGDASKGVSFLDIIWKVNAKIEETGSEVRSPRPAVVICSVRSLYRPTLLPLCCTRDVSRLQQEFCTSSALFWIVMHHCKGRVDAFVRVRAAPVALCRGHCCRCLWICRLQARLGAH